MTSLFDPWAKSRSQRTRLASLFQDEEERKKKEEEEQQAKEQSLFTPGTGDNLDPAGDRGKDRGGLPAYDNVKDWVGAMMGTPGILGPGMALDAMIGRGLFGKGQSNDYMTTDEAFNGMTQAQKEAQPGMAMMPGDPMLAAAVAEAQAASRDAAQQGQMGLDAGLGLGGQTAGGWGGTGVEGDKGFLAEGGKVTHSLFEGVDPPGPDDVIIAAKTGERVLNEAQYASLSPEAKAEVDAALKPKAKKQ